MNWKYIESTIGEVTPLLVKGISPTPTISTIISPVLKVIKWLQ